MIDIETGTYIPTSTNEDLLLNKVAIDPSEIDAELALLHSTETFFAFITFFSFNFIFRC